MSFVHFFTIFGILAAVLAQDNIFVKFLNFKDVRRGVVVTCKYEDWNYSNSGNHYMSYYDLGKRNWKLDKLSWHLKESSAAVGIFFNFDCENARPFLKNISSFHTFNAKPWLLKSGNLTAVKNFLIELDVHISSDVMVAIGDNSGNYKIYEVYKILENELIINEMPSWFFESYGNLSAYLAKSKITRRRNFKGVELIASITLPSFDGSFPTIDAYLESKNQTDVMQKKNYQVASVLKDIFNFSWKLLRSPEWGTMENNTWNGIIGLNQHHKANFSITTVRIYKERYEVVDYLPPTHIARIGFIFSHPRRMSLRNVFLEPFENTVWVVILILIMILAIIFRFTISFSSSEAAESSFSNLLLIITGAIMQQGTTNAFYRLSARILFSSALVLAFLIDQFYSAFLLGSLLSEPPKKINTIEKLYNSQLRIGMEDIPYNYDLLNITEPGKKILMKRILRGKQKNTLLIDEGLCLVKKGRFAFHVDIVGAYEYLAGALTDREFCQLMVVYVVKPFTVAMILPKQSPLKEYIANGILRMKEIGIWDYLNKFWSPKVPSCESNGQSVEQIAVGMEHMLPIFVMLSCAMLLSVVILIVECILFKYTNRV